MAKVRVKVNSRAARSILQSPAVAEDLSSRARRIASAAGSGMEVDSSVGPNRARAQVTTGNFVARRREATRKALSSAIDAGR